MIKDIKLKDGLTLFIEMDTPALDKGVILIELIDSNDFVIDSTTLYNEGGS